MKKFKILVIAGVMTACSSTPLKKIEGDDLPADLSVEQLEKFKILDSKPQPVPPPPVETKKKKKNKKDKELASVHKAAEPVVQKSTPETVLPPVRRPEIDPVIVGEALSYSVGYLGLSAGEFKVNVLPFKYLKDKKVYHLRGHAKTASIFNMVYRVDDVIESFYDYDGLYSHRFSMELDEKKQTRKVVELYDYENKKSFFWDRINHQDRGQSERKEYYDIEKWSQDSLSAMFFMRTLTYPDTGQISFPMVTEGKPWEVLIQVVKNEQRSTPWGKIATKKLKVETKFQGVMQKTGDNFIWISDDEKRLIIRIEAHVKVGYVYADLVERTLGSEAQ